MTENGNGRIIRFKVGEIVGPLSLKYDGGREVDSTYGAKQVLFSVVDQSTGGEKLMYTEVAVANRIEALKIRAGEPFTITKQEKKCWDIRRVTPPAPPYCSAPAPPKATAAAAPEPDSQLAQQLRASLAPAINGAPKLVPIAGNPTGQTADRYAEAQLQIERQLEVALKCSIAAFAKAEQFATEINYAVRFEAQHVYGAAVTIIIGAQRNGNGNGGH